MALQTELGRPILEQTRTYTDFDLNFGTYTSKDLKLKEGENAIKQSIQNLLLTNQYDRPFQPEINSGIYRYLFENFDSSTSHSVESAIRTTINKHEPRVSIDNLKVIAEEERNRININLKFSIVNSEQTKTVEFFIERLR